MENNEVNGVLTASTVKGAKKSHKFRDTVLVRIDRKIKEEVKGLSKRRHETMSLICDAALREYFESIKALGNN